MHSADTQPVTSSEAAPVPSTTSPVALVPRTRKRTRKALFYSALAVVPGALGVAVTALTRSKRAGALVTGTTALGMGLVRFQLQRLWSDEPTFAVEQTLGNIELRQYAGFVVAQTELSAPDSNAAMEAGFDIVFRYIGGGNAAGEKLEMTAPVITQRARDKWVVSFVMPAGRTLASLPTPHDRRVTLAEIPARRLAVLTYRGCFQPDVIEQHERELVRSVAFAGFATQGEPASALFDPPTTAPSLRRNEAWIEVPPT